MECKRILGWYKRIARRRQREDGVEYAVCRVGECYDIYPVEVAEMRGLEIKFRTDERH